MLGVSPDALEAEHAWGLMAARLGKTENRRAFFKQFWWDADWGLNEWLNLVAWPDAAQNRAKKLGKLAQLDPPPRSPEALARWRAARDGFQQALATCRRLRDELSTLDASGSQLTQTEAQLPAAEARLQIADQDLVSAERAVTDARADHEDHRQREATEIAKLSALSSVAPSRLFKLFRSRAWQAHEVNVHRQVERLNTVQDAAGAAIARLSGAIAEMERYAAGRQGALVARDALRADVARLYSPAFMTARIAVADTQIGGEPVAKESMLFMPFWMLHRNPALWSNPTRFDPARFFGTQPGRGQFLPFGLGPQVCIGAQLAMTEAVLALAVLLRDFHVALIDPGRPVLPVATLSTRPDHAPAFQLTPVKSSPFAAASR